MSIEYYAFALFISGLICLIAILCKVLFANVKRQQKLLDERETKLLQLYQTIESIMDEFGDQSKAAMEEIKEYETRAVKRAAELALLAAESQRNEPPAEPAKTEVFERLPRADKSDKSDPGRLKAAGEVLARAERIVKRDTLKGDEEPAKNENTAVFQRLFDETAGETPAVGTTKEVSSKQTRNEAIIALMEEGKTEAEIAQELSITQNEVKLVIGLTRR